MAHRIEPTICCGSLYTLSLSNNGDVYSFGNASYSQHGQDEETVFPPKVIPTLNNIKSIFVGVYHSACLDYDGNVFTFGRNNYG